jgi:hypothetical protein
MPGRSSIESSLAGTILRLAVTVLIIWVAGMFLRGLRALFGRPAKAVSNGSSARRRRASGFGYGDGAGSNDLSSPASASASGRAARKGAAPISRADIVDVNFTDLSGGSQPQETSGNAPAR